MKTPTLPTGRAFQKKVDAYEGPGGVGTIQGNVPAILDKFHQAVKKKNWLAAQEIYRRVHRELHAYQASVSKTITQVRKQGTDKKRLKVIDAWTVYLRDTRNKWAADGLIFRAMPSILKDMDAVEEELKAMKTSTSPEEVQAFFEDVVTPLRMSLKKLVAIDPAKRGQMKMLEQLATTAMRPDLHPKQAGQVLKALGVLLKQMRG
ncbi:MAG: hypothetical protein AAF442_05635 [Pseudomonadota bacterium]